jgi:ParB/RepB/Spo0J family partition protein
VNVSDVDPDRPWQRPALRRSGSGEDEAFAELVEALTEQPAVREGLPPSYRMRHDAHYVDQLARPAAPPIRMVAVEEIDGLRKTTGREIGPLVTSIGRYGLLQPLLVRRRSGRYELIAGGRRLAAAIAAGLAEVPCVLHDADESEARALSEATNTRATREEAPIARQSSRVAIPASALADLTEHLDAITCAMNLLSLRDRPLRDRVAIDLMRVEVQRAALLSAGLSVLAEDPVLARSHVDVPALLERVVAGMAPERTLAGFQVIVAHDEPVPAVHVDPRLLAVALGGGLAAMRAITERACEAVLRCSVGAEPDRNAVVIEISQTAVTFPASRLARFFDLAWSERPGGYRAAIGMLAARRITELHAGRTDMCAGDEGGCTLRLELPSEPPG